MLRDEGEGMDVRVGTVSYINNNTLPSSDVEVPDEDIPEDLSVREQNMCSPWEICSPLEGPAM